MIKIKCWSLLALPALLASCSSDDFRGSDSEGSIRLQLAVDTQPVGSSSSRAELNDLTIDDLKIRLKAADGKVREWNSKAEFEKEEKFAIGDYTLEAYYGQETDCGFEKPYVYGSTGITVHHGETTTATIEAALANSMVTVTYSENVSKFFTDYSVTLTGDNGPGVEYPVDVRPVYITPGKVQILFNYTDGAGETIVGVTDFTAEPAHHYRINIDINGGEIGDAVMKVSFDDTMEQHTEEIKLEDLTAPGAPVMSGTGFTVGTAVPVVAGVSRADDLYCGVIARGGLKSLKLTTVGASKISASWPAEIEFVGASEAQQNTLKNLGLTVRGLYGNGSGEDEKTDLVVVDFRNVIAKLPDATEGDIKFTLAAVDKYDQEPEDPISLALNVTPFEMVLSDAPAEVWEGEDAFSMTLTYNGGDPDANLQIMSINERGTSDMVPATFTKSADNKYTVNVTPTGKWGTSIRNNSIEIYAREKQGKRETTHTAIEYVKIPTVTVLDADVWATKAYVTIQDADDQSKYYEDALSCSIDGVNFTQELTPTGSNHLMLIEGLTPGTEYTLTARNPKDPTNTSRKLAPITFTTEAATQLPNSGMEEWYTTDVFTKQSWTLIGTTGMTDIKRYHPNKDSNESSWSTRNALTTGQTSGITCYYTSYSGTIPVTGVSGNAAEISTLGYGEGTTYAHISSGKEGSPKKKAVGMLFNGTYDANSDQPNLGIEFVSRPTSLTFQYKYAPVNNESFTAYIVVEHRENGNVVEIARGEITSSEKKSDFSEVTIPLTYNNSTLKATHIYTMFKSSTAADNDTKVLSQKGSKSAADGYSDSKYVGSVLTVDEIKLNY